MCQLTSCIVFVFLYGTMTVSYTHLDVYKRQMYTLLTYYFDKPQNVSVPRLTKNPGTLSKKIRVAAKPRAETGCGKLYGKYHNQISIIRYIKEWSLTITDSKDQLLGLCLGFEVHYRVIKYKQKHTKMCICLLYTSRCV